MKIVVYTIALNEEKFVDRFMNSICNEADGVYVTDTGSTDGTVEALRRRGAQVDVIKLKPWRFDVARNISMQLVPADVDLCVCIDLDEVLSPGWRKCLEEAYLKAEKKPDRVRYQYVWNTLPDGREGTTYWYDKIHTRGGFRWVKPVHETLAFYKGEETQLFVDGFKLYHYPDPTKSRGSYLSLLELSVREEPEDDRNSHYLGREYMYYGMWDHAIAELKRHLTLKRATWNAERAASMRYIARCLQALGQLDEAERWLLRACAEEPRTREPWVEYGKFLYETRKDHVGCYAAMTRALAIKERPNVYLNEPSAWGYEPHNLAGVSAYWMGMRAEGVELIRQALAIEPNNEYLRENLRLAGGKVE